MKLIPARPRKLVSPMVAELGVAIKMTRNALNDVERRVLKTAREGGLNGNRVNHIRRQLARLKKTLKLSAATSDFLFDTQDWEE